MKKSISVFGVILFIAVGLFLILSDGTATMAELCGIGEEERVAHVEIVTASKSSTFREKSTVYTEGAVYDRFVSIFFEERISGQKSEGWITAHGLYSCAKIVYSFENGVNAVLVVPPKFGEIVNGEPLYAILLTDITFPREEYIIYPENWFSFEELERLARADSE